MTESQLALMEAYWQGSMPVETIAKRIGCSVGAINRAACDHRDRFPYRHKQFLASEREECVARVVSGESTYEDEAERLGVVPYTVRRWVLGRDGKAGHNVR